MRLRPSRSTRTDPLFPYWTLSRSRVPQGAPAAPCFVFPDSYGVAARLRAERESRMASAFRDLGAIEIDAPLPDEPAPEPADDGYRYGGRFSDPAPSNETPNGETESRPSPSGAGLIYPS